MQLWHWFIRMTSWEKVILYHRGGFLNGIFNWTFFLFFEKRILKENFWELHSSQERNRRNSKNMDKAAVLKYIELFPPLKATLLFAKCLYWNFLIDSKRFYIFQIWKHRSAYIFVSTFTLHFSLHWRIIMNDWN